MDKDKHSRLKRIRSGWRLILFLGIGIIIRVLPVMRSDYPLGSGGLFYYIIDEIASKGRLPSEIPYYSCGIPFAYPPLGFTAYALLLRWTGIHLFVLLKWSPVFLSIAALVAFVFLAREFLEGLAWEVAVLCFATIPIVSLQVSASDAIRNLAFLFYLVGILALHRALSHPSRKVWPCVAGILFGLTVLTHPGIAFGFLAVAVLLALYFGASRKGQRPILVVGICLAVAVLVASPWIFTLHRHYGVAFIGMMKNAFLSRSKAHWFMTVLRFSTKEPFGQIWGVAAVIGALYSLIAGNPFLALWLLATPTHSHTHVFGTPVALCAGASLGLVIAPQLRSATRFPRAWVDALLLFLLTAYAAGSALVFSVTPDTPLIGRYFGAMGVRPQVTDARLDAWDWMSKNLAPSSWVVIVGEEKEWVPAFAHVCANIPQGAEWIGKHQTYGQLYDQIAGAADYAGLIAVLERNDQPVEYLYVSTTPSPQFLESEGVSEQMLRKLLADVGNQESITKVFENEEVALYDLAAHETP